MIATAPVQVKADFIGFDETDDAIAWFVVSTDTPDRSGDVILPAGCLQRLESFARNPLWFFNHNMDGLPIGVCEDRNGQLMIEVQEDRIYAGCRFHLETPESRDVFNLVTKGYLKGASITYLPHSIVPIDRDTELVEDWELLEISVVGVPDNPEALILESPVIRKSFGGAMAEKKKIKVGAKVLHKIYRAHKSMTDAARELMDETENDKVQKALQKYCKEMDGWTEGLSKSITDIYPDMKLEEMDGVDDDKEEDSDEDAESEESEGEEAEEEEEEEEDKEEKSADDDDKEEKDADKEDDDKQEKAAVPPKRKKKSVSRELVRLIEALDTRLSLLEERE